MRLSGLACISSNLTVSVRMRLPNSAWSSASADPPIPNNKHPVISKLMKETIAHRWELCNKAGCKDYAVWGEDRPSTDAEARCLATASAIVATLWRTSRAHSGVGILSPYFLSSATTSWRASTESRPRLPAPKRVCSSPISSVVICSMRFSTINCLISRLSVPLLFITTIQLFTIGMEPDISCAREQAENERLQRSGEGAPAAARPPGPTGQGVSEPATQAQYSSKLFWTPVARAIRRCDRLITHDAMLAFVNGIGRRESIERQP